MTSMNQGVIALPSRSAVPLMRWVGGLVVVTVAAGIAIFSFSSSAGRPKLSDVDPVSDADPDIRKAHDLLEHEYLTKLRPALRGKTPVRCQHVHYLKRNITWCGFDSGAGRLASRGYWELERVGDEVIIYAMNGEAHRALKELTGAGFKPGYKQPFLDLNALEAAYAMNAGSAPSAN